MRKHLQFFKIFFLLLTSILFLSCSEKPNIYHDTQGNAYYLSDFKGKWVIVNYWAIWCESCLKEIPELNNFYKHNHKNIIFLGVNFDQLSADTLKEAVYKHHINFPTLLEDPTKDWQLGDVTLLPITFIINPKGEVVKKIIGPSTEKSLNQILQQLQK